MHLLFGLLIAINKSSQYGLNIATIHQTYSSAPLKYSKIALVRQVPPVFHPFFICPWRG